MFELIVAVGLVLLFLGKDDGRNWTPGRGGDGSVWGADPSSADAPSSGPVASEWNAFDFAGNGLWISPDCDVVFEGETFWPKTSSYSAIEAPTLAGVLAIEGNSVIGYVDVLIDQQGFTDPVEIAAQILREASPLCADVDPNLWGAGLRDWFNDFVERLIPLVDESVNGIEFGEDDA